MSISSVDELQEEIEMNDDTVFDDTVFDEESWNKRLENRKQASSVLGSFLLQGWTMMAEHCETCASPMMKLRDGEPICKVCASMSNQSSTITNTSVNTNLNKKSTAINEEKEQNANIPSSAANVSPFVMNNNTNDMPSAVDDQKKNGFSFSPLNNQKQNENGFHGYEHEHGFHGFHGRHGFHIIGRGGHQHPPSAHGMFGANPRNNLENNTNENVIHSNISGKENDICFDGKGEYGKCPAGYGFGHGFGHGFGPHGGHGFRPHGGHGFGHDYGPHGGCPYFGWRQKHHMHRVIGDTVKTVLDRMSIINERMAASNISPEQNQNQDFSAYSAELQDLMKFLCSVQAFKRQMRE